MRSHARPVRILSTLCRIFRNINLLCPFHSSAQASSSSARLLRCIHSFIHSFIQSKLNQQTQIAILVATDHIRATSQLLGQLAVHPSTAVLSFPIMCWWSTESARKSNNTFKWSRSLPWLAACLSSVDSSSKRARI